MTLIFLWVAVRCQKCGKTHCEVERGTKVRWKCPRCRTWQIIET